MKTKLVIALAVMVCVLGLLGCGNKPNADTAGITFQANILEINNETLLIAPVEGSQELKSADQFSVAMKNIESSPEPEFGDIIEITYNGEIQESYPVGLGEIYNIRVIE